MSDSGGFQIFSLAVSKEHGVGKIAPIFPKEEDRGGHFSTKKGKPLLKVDMERTHRWAVSALEEFQHTSDNSQALLGIVQGGADQDLRQQSATFVADQGFDAYAIGGSLGRSKQEMCQVLEWTIPLLPQDKPFVAKELLGIRLVTVQNLYFLESLMCQIRTAVREREGLRH